MDYYRNALISLEAQLEDSITLSPMDDYEAGMHESAELALDGVRRILEGAPDA